MKRSLSAISVAATLLLIGAGCASMPPQPDVPAPTTAPTTVTEPPPATETVVKPPVPPPTPPATAPAPEKKQSSLGEPLPNALARVTKKTFGLKVSPGHSPVSPERFSGYHCGVDFETTSDEQDVDVPVSAVCDGPLLLKKRATGYGGVAVQGCKLDGRDVTVVYGHLRLESVTAKIGSALDRGAAIGILGKGYSTETDGERKHLHLGIHIGKTVDIRGYVQTAGELAGWLDAAKYMAP